MTSSQGGGKELQQGIDGRAPTIYDGRDIAFRLVSVKALERSFAIGCHRLF